MALQDLTPQLRTRLGRVERAVGVFIGLAFVLMLVGFGYYVYHTAQRKGWFLTKAPYFTYVHSAAGLKIGDTVKLMGFDAGEITRITAEEPFKPYDVYIEFFIKAPYYGYVWDDSRVKIATGDLLGNRYLEVSKGGSSGRTNRLFATYKEKNNILTEIYDDKLGVYTNFTSGSSPYWLLADESPALNIRLEALANQVEKAMPSFLNLTNQLSSVLTNAANAVTKLDTVIHNAQLIATNLADITTRLRDPHGSLGEWLLPTSLQLQLQQTLTNANAALITANSTLTTVDTNLTALVVNLGRSLDHLANLTSNLSSQVQGNTNLVTAISDAITHTDDLVQGLKRHWLLRSAFRGQTNQRAKREAAKPPRR